MKPKASDKEKLKLLSQDEEDIIDINDVPSTLVEDSDEEEDFELPPPPPALKRHDSVVAPVETPVETVAEVQVETVAPVEEAPKKKTVIKKKSKE